MSKYPEYTDLENCPKCGRSFHVEFGAPPEVRHVTHTNYEPDEHLMCTCRGCGYYWRERPLDTPPDSENES